MSMQQKANEATPLSKYIHSIIGIAIMVFGPLFSSPQFSFPVTAKLESLGFPIVDGYALISFSEAGWTAVIIFIGLLYLWLIVDTFWPSILGVIIIALSPHYPLPLVFSQYFGNQITFYIFFILFFVSALVKSQVVNHIVVYILTRNVLQGRPWLLILFLMIATYLGAMMSNLPSIFMVWPVVYVILTEVGVKPGDKLATFLVGNAVAGMIFAVFTDMIKGPALYMASGYINFVSKNPDLGLEQISLGPWLIFAFVITVCSTLLILFCMRYIFRVDVEPIRQFNTDKFKENPLPPMDWKQKWILFSFIAFILWMTVPSLLPKTWPIVAYFKSKTYLGSFMLFFIFIFVKRKGEPLVKIDEFAAGVPWGLFFLLAATFYFGGLLTNPNTNIPIILDTYLSNALLGLDYIAFLAFILVLAFILTNLLNSIVTGIIVAPIIATVALGYGFDVMPIICLFILVLASAILTPAAGVPGALLYGNKEWLPGNSALLYAIFFSTVVSIVTVVVGIPLALILF